MRHNVIANAGRAAPKSLVPPTATADAAALLCCLHAASSVNAAAAYCCARYAISVDATLEPSRCPYTSSLVRSALGRAADSSTGAVRHTQGAEEQQEASRRPAHSQDAAARGRQERLRRLQSGCTQGMGVSKHDIRTLTLFVSNLQFTPVLLSYVLHVWYAPLMHCFMTMILGM